MPKSKKPTDKTLIRISKNFFAACEDMMASDSADQCLAGKLWDCYEELHGQDAFVDLATALDADCASPAVIDLSERFAGALLNNADITAEERAKLLPLEQRSAVVSTAFAARGKSALAKLWAPQV